MLFINHRQNDNLYLTKKELILYGVYYIYRFNTKIILHSYL